MKSLYESILDDEDVLVNQTKDDLNNSLNLLIHTIKKGDKQQIESLVQNGVLDDFF